MINLLYIDLFCGAGGTSTGINSARLDGEECAKVVACVNHDANAIASHASNHPDALHFTEDIRTLELSPLVCHLQECHAANPGALTVLWASLECTNFSRAKGGQPRDADSRTLAEHLFRYIEAINPDYIQIENVEEFMSWGEVDENGKPISMDKGKSYLRWVRNVKRYGYNFEHRILNAADYGAYTSRKRFFGIFARKGLPVVFPEPTHCKNGSRNLFADLQPWKPVREVLDFSNEGRSIFDREKPLSEKTLERIYAGLIKFVAGGKDAFMVKYNSVNQKTGKYCPPSLDAPCPTVATQNRLALAQVSFLSKQYGGHPYSKNVSVDGPAGTVTARDHHMFISVYHGNGHVHSVCDPSPTVTTVNRLSLVKPCFIDMYYGNGKPTSIDAPSGCVTTNPKQALVTVCPWIMDTNFGNVGASIDAPSRVITANHKQHYLMNPQFTLPDSSVGEPCFTLIARMDKRPPHLIVTESGGMAIRVFSTDSPMMVKIKEFMALYSIIDIKMRMLMIDELKLIMGFPKDYILIGTQAEQKKFIGNAVEVTIARKWCEALCSGLRDFDLTKKYHSKQAAEKTDAKILDACCGGKMFYFDKHDKRVLFQDIREIETTLCDGRRFEVSPDVVADFTNMPYPCDHFSMVVFDPPHLKYSGSKKELDGWQMVKYGALRPGWRETISKGFAECFRVLRPGGFLIFKWNETDVKVLEILKLTPQKPIFGHISGKCANTHWICFMKE